MESKSQAGKPERALMLDMGQAELVSGRTGLFKVPDLSY
jgi:hypothetical protein